MSEFAQGQAIPDRGSSVYEDLLAEIDRYGSLIELLEHKLAPYLDQPTTEPNTQVEIAAPAPIVAALGRFRSRNGQLHSIINRIQ